MNNITYLYEPDKGKIFDFIAVLNLYTRCSKLEDLFSEIGIHIHDIIKNAFSRMHSLIRKNDRFINLFFSTGENGECFFSNIFEKNLINANSIDDLLVALQGIDASDLLIKLLSFYDTKNDFSDTFYMLLLQNKKLLMEFLNGIHLESEIKWNILNLVESPEEIIAELLKSLKSIASELELEYKYNHKFIQDYYNIIREKFENSGDCFIKGKTGYYEKLIIEGKCTTVRFAISLFAPYTIQYKVIGRTLNVYLGYDYELGLQAVHELQTDEISFFKAFTDTTRLRIINSIKQGELFASEIGEQLGLPLSSLSHHLDILYQSGLVDRRSEGKRIFYKIKPDSMNTAIRLIRKIVA